MQAGSPVGGQRGQIVVARLFATGLREHVEQPADHPVVALARLPECGQRPPLLARKAHDADAVRTAVKITAFRAWAQAAKGSSTVTLQPSSSRRRTYRRWRLSRSRWSK